ncbi:hypothetical protein GCM10007108_08890 [Thermogymnomonas acidicola]|uniref:DAHP synthetase I/KDSA domain-containing protein n=1 Tax=Thermogymnomonas acidicola TaxID=399579 RepID=A0AA37BR37_9ARCH|nr:3-deoxy-7-phosphoheptulonate synthase [Thermogymnomonas acidicola]GGM73049.1 hypothetical protein GCM10007108_08890 [Thermogymnomonas acidicola]
MRDFMFIAGPCAVESREQIMEAAHFLSSLGIRYLRGGAFKPRTDPDSFQGLGEAGLRYLREAADTYGMKVVSEVMSEEQIPLAEELIDVLQIGSRNCQNFSLLRKVGAVGKPVLLKRGFGMTVDEFLKASRYIEKEGNTEIILVERGIRTFEQSTRFTLDISAVPVIKERCSYPVVVDPSHPAGQRRYVEPLALAGVAAGADGLMVEVHPDPDRALSDARQQLDFQSFARLHSRVQALLSSLSPIDQEAR